MKTRLFAIFSVIAILLSMVGAAPAQAAAYGTSFVTSITYQNVGTAAATIMIDFYAESSATPISIPMAALNPGASSSVYVGGLSQIASPFKGSAVMNSDQPLVATLVQVPPSASDVKNRPLSNGFTGGAAYVVIPTVLKATFNSHSVFSVQNADSVGADLTINFVPVTGTVVPVTVTNLPPGAAKYYDLAQMAQLGTTFNGSVTISAKKTGTATDGAVVATSMELSTTGTGVYAFEGAAQVANKVYLPSAFCKFSTNGATNSSYAVQNVSATTDASVTVTYSNGNVDGPYTIAPGKKQSFSGCGVSGTLNPAGFIGSAVVESVGGEIAAIAKIFGNGLSTAFLGATQGAKKIALPYVRWTNTHWTDGTRQRANIAIQNVGAAQIPANAITVKYYDKSGTLLGTHTIATALNVGQKANSNPLSISQTEFGYIGTTTGGGAIVEGPDGSQLAVIVRIETYIPGGSVGEDYNGIPVQ